MKTLFTIMLALITMTAFSQKVYNLDTVKSPQTKEQVIGKATPTKDMAIYQGVSYPVYITVNNKIFFVVQSKSGNWYKKYIKQ